MILVITLLLVLYSILILAFIIGFYLQKEIILEEKSNPHTAFSIVIPFRNEEENLLALLKSIAQLNYPTHLFEILLIDDESTDQSVAIIKEFQNSHSLSLNPKILNNQRKTGSPKKDALCLAINKSKNEWILTTDADCIIPSNWLLLYEQQIQLSSASFIAGPVSFLEGSNYFLDAFQKLDFLSLQGATIGSFGLRKPFMCNGANLAFKKSEFIKHSGYTGNTEIASGDDLFLMQKFIQDNTEKVAYLKSKEAIVQTQQQKSWSALFEQRKRWAAKSSAYKNWFGILVSWLVFLANLAFIVALFYPKTYYFLILKIIVDFILIAQAALFLKQKNVLKSYLWCALGYPLFTLVIVLSSQFSHYTWKKRIFKK